MAGELVIVRPTVLVFGQIPVVVYVIVYVPIVLPLKLIKPVEVFKNIKPAVEENTPPGKPVTVAEGLIPDWQKVADEYENEASSNGLTVMVTVIGFPAQLFADGVIV